MENLTKFYAKALNLKKFIETKSLPLGNLQNNKISKMAKKRGKSSLIPSQEVMSSLTPLGEKKRRENSKILGAS
jgi:hypothetical protein